VLLLGWLSTTVTLIKAMLPALLTVPIKIKGWPRGTGPGGQFFVTVILGRTSVGQAALALAMTLLPVQIFAPTAVKVSKYSQQFGGTASLPVKLAI
jgi:hypothetical protein